uniref:Uncharacterized protein n=1 Tax=Leptobrachium leishanense TaxID=445787 RepID=A0A8C5PMQ4_9ANUR
MASADLRDELTCSICLSIYTDPVTLLCGHSFCRTCIRNVLDTQEGSGAYKCPECRAEFQERPTLVNVRKLRNIAENIRSKHSKSNRKCSSHREILRYYCCEDATCICVSCRLDGDHRGHQVETLNEASEKKKEKLRNILQKLTSQREEAEKRVQSLQELRRQVQGKATWVSKRVTALIRDIREQLEAQLEALEKQVLSEISGQEEQVSLRVSCLIRQLKIKKEELTRKMGDIMELCLTRIVTRITRQCRVPEASDMLLDVNMASDMLLDVNTASDMLLDVNTAGNYVSVSEDFKTVSWSRINQSRSYTPERFQDYPQVLSSGSFSAGRHYWEVEVSESGEWMVGMTYPSIKRRGLQSMIGKNKKSWGLWRRGFVSRYLVMHDTLGQTQKLVRVTPRERGEGDTANKVKQYVPHSTLLWALFTK